MSRARPAIGLLGLAVLLLVTSACDQGQGRGFGRTIELIAWVVYGCSAAAVLAALVFCTVAALLAWRRPSRGTAWTAWLAGLWNLATAAGTAWMGITLLREDEPSVVEAGWLATTGVLVAACILDLLLAHRAARRSSARSPARHPAGLLLLGLVVSGFGWLSASAIMAA